MCIRLVDMSNKRSFKLQTSKRLPIHPEALEMDYIFCIFLVLLNFGLWAELLFLRYKC
jgi:hypothetical protein